MAGIVEKTYSEALFSAALEKDEKLVAQINSELEAVEKVLDGCPDFIKLSNTPTIPMGEKFDIVKDAFGGRVSDYTYNYILLLVEKGRLSYFKKIRKCYRDMYNEYFNNAEILVTSSVELSAEQLGKIEDKMREILGKNIIMTTKVDKSLIGGVVVDYGDRRFDGSVKTRLESLRQNLSELIG